MAVYSPAINSGPCPGHDERGRSGQMQSMKSRLSDEKLLAQLVTSITVDALLSTLQIQSSTPLSDSSEEGEVLFGVAEQALGAFNLNIIPPPAVDPARA